MKTPCTTPQFQQECGSLCKEASGVTRMLAIAGPKTSLRYTGIRIPGGQEMAEPGNHPRCQLFGHLFDKGNVRAKVPRFDA